MKTLLLLSLICLAVVRGTSNSPLSYCEDQPPLFGDYASNFNTFVFEDFVAQNSETEGRLLAGNNLRITNYAVGCRVFSDGSCIQFGSVTCGDIEEQNELRDFLVAGNDMTITNIEVKTGDIVYGGELTRTNIGLVDDCQARQADLDLSDDIDYLENLSQRISDLENTGEVSEQYGTVTFTGSQEPQVEVFSIDGSLLSRANGIRFENYESTASIFINVREADSLTAGNFGFLGDRPSASNILWNFPHTNTLTFQSVGWEGSILAPNAQMLNPAGEIFGQTFARSWSSEGWYTAAQRQVPFVGCLPSPPTEICEDIFGEIPSLFNTFVLEDFECHNCQTEGRLGAGGDISIACYSIACNLEANQSENKQCIEFESVTCQNLEEQDAYPNSVIAGGSFTARDASVQTGNIIYGDSFNVDTFGLVNDCESRRDSVVDIRELRDLLWERSQCLASKEPTGRVSYHNHHLTLQGTDSEVEIFNVPGDQLERISSFRTQRISQNATILINVNGNNLRLGGFDYSNALEQPQYVLFNFYEVETLSFYDIAWRGSVLAPNGNIHNPRGVLKGQVFARSWKAPRGEPCMSQENYPFEGCLPLCPE